jgi:hypothetical protein
MLNKFRLRPGPPLPTNTKGPPTGPPAVQKIISVGKSQPAGPQQKNTTSRTDIGESAPKIVKAVPTLSEQARSADATHPRKRKSRPQRKPEAYSLNGEVGIACAVRPVELTMTVTTFQLVVRNGRAGS